MDLRILFIIQAPSFFHSRASPQMLIPLGFANE
jgi:hypothetical protein